MPKTTSEGKVVTIKDPNGVWEIVITMPLIQGGILYGTGCVTSTGLRNETSYDTLEDDVDRQCYNAAIEGMLALILALSIEGVGVKTKQMMESIAMALASIESNFR